MLCQCLWNDWEKGLGHVGRVVGVDRRRVRDRIIEVALPGFISLALRAVRFLVGVLLGWGWWAATACHCC